jgi:hypothetical protein
MILFNCIQLVLVKIQFFLYLFAYLFILCVCVFMCVCVCAMIIPIYLVQWSLVDNMGEGKLSPLTELV